MSALEDLAAAEAKADSRANFATFIAGRRAADLTPKRSAGAQIPVTWRRNR